MPASLMLVADLVAITILVFAIYFPRHRRKDLAAAFLGVNVGVVAVAGALTSTEVGAGLGLGLFGVLSIIRLRSTELDHEEIAYYFAALALGLLGGLSVDASWFTVALMAAVVVALFVGDHPRLFGNTRCQVVHLDRAFTDETALAAHLERLLGAEVTRLKVRKLDLVNDRTNVEVRYRLCPDRVPVAAPQLDADYERTGA